MYAGRIVETRPTRRALRPTRSTPTPGACSLAAAARADAEERLMPIPGMPPSLLRPPPAAASAALRYARARRARRARAAARAASAGEPPGRLPRWPRRRRARGRAPLRGRDRRTGRAMADAAARQVENLKKHFPITPRLSSSARSARVQAVDGVSFDGQARARRSALVGESRLRQVHARPRLMRLHRAHRRRRRVRRPRHHRRCRARALRRCGASMQMVFQDPYAR